MKLHRFYIPKEQIEPSSLGIGVETMVHFPELAHQMKNVLRLQTGERVILFFGDGKEYLSEIVSFEGKGVVEVKIIEITENNVSFGKEVYLFFSIIKKDNVDWILEKGTEVGILHFIPIVSSRSEKKDLNIKRAEKIVTEATEQCGRNSIPKVHPVMKLDDVFNKFDMSFIAFEKSDDVSFTKNIKDNPIGLLVGPEGGWTKEELELFKNKKVVFQSLGKTTFRAETAAIVGSAFVLNQ